MSPQPTTPPPKRPFQHYDTPKRASILAVRKFCNDRAIPYRIQDVFETFEVSEAAGRRILRSKRARTLHNDSNQEEPWGWKHAISEETAKTMENHIEEAQFAENHAISYWEIEKKFNFVKDNHVHWKIIHEALRGCNEFRCTACQIFFLLTDICLKRVN